jgi:hypothetical protein
MMSVVSWSVVPCRRVSVNVTPNGRGDALLDTAGWTVVGGGGGGNSGNSGGGDSNSGDADAGGGGAGGGGGGGEPSEASGGVTLRLDEVFITPEERSMTFGAFLDMLDAPDGGSANTCSGATAGAAAAGAATAAGAAAPAAAGGSGGRGGGRAVPYVSRQCGSLVDEFSPLIADCAADLPWATEAGAY